MIKRTWIIAMVAVLLMATLGGCAMGDVSVPDRAVDISIDAAMEGQNLGLQGLMAGSVTWNESQFSSFLTELVRQNGGENQPVDSITAWFSPENVVNLRVGLKDGVLTAGNNIDLAGKLIVQDGHLMVDLSGAGFNGMSISGPVMSIVSSTINRILSDPQFGVAVGVETGEGVLTVNMGGM